MKRGDFDIETCPPADSGSFCEAVGREGLVRGVGVEPVLLTDR